MKPVADEAGRGYTCGTSRGAGATYARSRAPAQPAPRSTCTASPYTPRPAGRAQRDSVGAGCGRAAGQVSWRRVGSVGRFDRLWHTDGRPFVRGAHQRLWQLGRSCSWPCRFECTRECNNEGGSLFVLAVKRNNELIVEPNAHCRAHCSNNEPQCPHY